MSLGQNLRRLRAQRELTLAKLAELSGVEVGTINALENRNSVRSQYAPALAKALQVSLDELVGNTPHQAGETPQSKQAVARNLSQSDVTICPVIPWETLMTTDSLPPRFEVLMPDDSMTPRVRAGQPITFSSRETPRPGDGVLVRDGHGHYYVRIYRQRTASTWECHALNDAYTAMESERDALTVLAVVVGVPARWG